MQMQEVQSDGSTLRETLQAVERMSGDTPEQLANKKELPPIARFAWEFFLKLNSRRGSNGFGPSSLSYAEIKAFCELEGIVLESWELQMILELDSVAMQSMNAAQEKTRKTEESKSKVSRKRK